MCLLWFLWFTLPTEKKLTTHYLYIHMNVHVMFVVQMSNQNQTLNYILNKLFYLFWKTKEVYCKLCEEVFDLESSLKFHMRGKCTSLKVLRFCNDCANSWQFKNAKFVMNQWVLCLLGFLWFTLPTKQEINNPLLIHTYDLDIACNVCGTTVKSKLNV